MSYQFAKREDGKPGCCRCGVAIDATYVTASQVLGPPILATEQGWLALCVPCFEQCRKEEDHETLARDSG